jgi:transposase
MKDTDFFSELLGIHFPWHIKTVEMNHQLKRVDIWIEHALGIEFPCPVCKHFNTVYDHSPQREIRHLNTCQMATYLHLRVPRVHCAEHGVKQIVSGLGEDNATVTFEFENFVLDLEQECSIEGTCRLVGIDWKQAWRIHERAVVRGLARKPHRIPKRIGIDEKSFAKGHKYETIVHDIDTGTVEYVCDDREQESLERYYKQFKPEKLAEVQSVAMDMWDPFIAATKKHIPDAEQKIVFDRYHVTRIITKAVDDIRKEEHRELMKEKDDTLKGTKYLWLWNDENIPEYRRDEFERLRAKNLKVCRARAIKENIRHMWDYQRKGWMNRFFKDWYFWATHCRLEPMVKAAKSIKAHFENISTYATHRITNALGESLNSKIEKVKRLACGFRNRAHYRSAIFFHCGGLDLYPKRRDWPFQILCPQ